MVKARHVRPVKDYGAPKRKQRVIPDQSMSITELVKRYVRGIPSDVVQRDAVYVDQSDIDLEKAARADFAEKAELAKAMQGLAEERQAEIEERSAAREAKRREKANAQQASPQTPDKGAGIGSLDNTMPVDTTQKPK